MAIGPTVDTRPGLKLPQFRLRTLFLGVTLCGVLFAVMGAIGPLGSLGLVMGLVMVGLHVAGNALGTALRDQSPAHGEQDAERNANFIQPPAGNYDSQKIQMPTPRLYQHAPLGSAVRVASGLGALVGGSLGGVLFGKWLAASLPGVVVGSISFGVLGAFFGFLAGSFWDIAFRAWNQASRQLASDMAVRREAFDSRRDKSPMAN